jgi:hypothetical protein
MDTILIDVIRNMMREIEYLIDDGTIQRENVESNFTWKKAKDCIAFWDSWK